MYPGRGLPVAFEPDERVVVGDAVVHVLDVLRAVRVRVRQVHAGAVVVVRRPRAAVRRLVVRLVTGQRPGLRPGPGPRRARLAVRLRPGCVASSTYKLVQLHT